MSAVSFIGETGVDDRTSAELVFPDGATANFECALREARPHAAVIQGDSGRLEIPAPWHPPADNAEVILYPADGEAECYRTGDGLPLFAREALDVLET